LKKEAVMPPPPLASPLFYFRNAEISCV